MESQLQGVACGPPESESGLGLLSAPVRDREQQRKATLSACALRAAAAPRLCSLRGVLALLRFRRWAFLSLCKLMGACKASPSSVCGLSVLARTRQLSQPLTQRSADAVLQRPGPGPSRVRELWVWSCASNYNAPVSASCLRFCHEN